jgi:hypothetical protein
MLLYLGKKLPPDFTKANDSDLKFLDLFPYPYTVALSSGNFFYFLWSRVVKGDGPTTIDLNIDLVHRLQDLLWLFLPLANDPFSTTSRTPSATQSKNESYSSGKSKKCFY